MWVITLTLVSTLARGNEEKENDCASRRRYAGAGCAIILITLQRICSRGYVPEDMFQKICSRGYVPEDMWRSSINIYTRLRQMIE
jgi:hypothetical protein